MSACYAPAPKPGSPCVDGTCPRPLVCSSATLTCELTDVDSGTTPSDGPADATPADAIEHLIDGCTPSPEICGDGIDQDCNGSDAQCPANDLASGAIDVTSGGTFTVNLAAAHDDNSPHGCGGAGGRDVFYKVNLTAPQVFYVDTFGSNFDTVVRVFAGACTAIGATQTTTGCGDDSCGGKQSQLALSLPTGASCIVVDQKSSAETAGSVTLKITPEGRNGIALASGVQTNTGNTCNATNVMEPSAACADTGAPDIAYFFTECPGAAQKLDADTCVDGTYDSALYVRRGATELACNDDFCDVQSQITNVAISGANFFWVVVDGYSSGDCGAYTLTTNLR